MPAVQDVQTRPTATPPQRPPPPACVPRRHHSESPSHRHHHNSPNSLTSSSPHLSSESLRNERDRRPVRSERRRHHEPQPRHERHRRRGSDHHRNSNPQAPRGRRRPEITILSAQPMADHPAFADGDKGGYVPPEAPPSYEQAMRAPLPLNPTFTDPALPDHIFDSRRIFPHSHIVNSNAITVPAYSVSVTSHNTPTVTSSTPFVTSPQSRNISTVTSPVNSSLTTSTITSQREVRSCVAHSPTPARRRNANHSDSFVNSSLPTSTITSQREVRNSVAQSPIPARRRNINHSNNSTRPSSQEDRQRSQNFQPPRTSNRTADSPPSTSANSNSTTRKNTQKPALPSKNPVLRPKPRTTIQNPASRTRTNISYPANLNNSSNITGQRPFIGTNSKLTESSKISNDTSSSSHHGTVTPSTSSITHPEQAMSTQPPVPASRTSKDIMSLFDEPASSSLPAPLMPSSSLSTPTNMDIVPPSDMSQFDSLFSTQPLGGSTSGVPTPTGLHSPLMQATNGTPNSGFNNVGGISQSANSPQMGSMLQPTNVSPQKPAMHRSPPPMMLDNGFSAPTAQQGHILTPNSMAPPSGNISLGQVFPQKSAPAPSKSLQPGPILTTSSLTPPSGSHPLGTMVLNTPPSAQPPLLSSTTSMTPPGGPTNRKLPPPPRPSSGPKRKPSVPSVTPLSPNSSSIMGQYLSMNNAPPHGGTVVSGQPQMGLLSSTQPAAKPTLGGANATPILTDDLLAPTSVDLIPPDEVEFTGRPPQNLDLFSVGPTQNGPQSVTMLSPTLSPAPVPRKNTNGEVPTPVKAPTLYANEGVEEVYAGVAKKRTVHFKVGEASNPTPQPAGRKINNTASSGFPLLDKLEPSKNELVGESPPPLPATRPPLEDFEDLLSPSEMNKALAEREKSQKVNVSPQNQVPQNSNIEDLLGFGSLSSPQSTAPGASPNSQTSEGAHVYADGEFPGRELPRVVQTSAPSILPRSKKNIRKQSDTGGSKENVVSTPPPLPKNRPTLPEGGTVIYMAPESKEGPSPETTPAMRKKSEDTEASFTKKLRRKSMKLKKGTMNLFKTKTIDPENPKPSNEPKTPDAGDSHKQPPTAKPNVSPLRQPRKIDVGESPKQPPVAKPSVPPSRQPPTKPSRPTSAPPPRPTALPNQTVSSTPLTSQLLISPTTVAPTQILNNNDQLKPKPSKPPPPKLIPSRAAPARPPPRSNTNQNNHTSQPPVLTPLLQPLPPTPKPRSNSRNEAPPQQKHPPVAKPHTVLPSRGAPTRTQAKPSRPPPGIPPQRKIPDAVVRSPPNKPIRQNILPTPTLEGSKAQSSNVNVTEFDHFGSFDGEMIEQSMLPQSQQLTVDKAIEMNPQTQDLNLSAVAVYDFNGAANDELVFKTGDQITKVTLVNQDWLKGWCNGKCGIFPRGFVTFQTSQQKPATVTQVMPTSQSATPTGQGAPPTTAYPTWDNEPAVSVSQDEPPFHNEENAPPSGELATPTGESPEKSASTDLDDLSRSDTPSSDKFFDAKDEFDNAVSATVTDTGVKSSGILDPDFVSKSQSSDFPIATDMVQRTAAALFSFTGQDVSELTFVEGDVITLTGEVNEEWLTGKLNGKEGMFPAAYIDQKPPQEGSMEHKIIGTTNPTHIPSSQAPTNNSIAPSGGGFVEPTATGIKDYTAPSSGEVSFKINDVLYLLEKVDSDWFMVQHEASSDVGKVPASHVKVIHPLPEGGGSMSWNY